MGEHCLVTFWQATACICDGCSWSLFTPPVSKAERSHTPLASGGFSEPHGGSAHPSTDSTNIRWAVLAKSMWLLVLRETRSCRCSPKTGVLSLVEAACRCMLPWWGSLKPSEERGALLPLPLEALHNIKPCLLMGVPVCIPVAKCTIPTECTGELKVHWKWI